MAIMAGGRRRTGRASLPSRAPTGDLPMVSVMNVELLWWDGCPSQPRALSDLRAAMADLGLDPDAIELLRIESEDDAVRERFVGSPTIRIDGLDASPAEDEPYGLNCRIYHRRDGRVSPTPDPADLRDALSAAMKTTIGRS
jgi:hypothetical protein